VYLMVDTIWVLYIPRCIPTNPATIIFHHCITLLIILIPATITQFSWHMGVALLVEYNTLFLTVKRNLEKGSWLNLLFEGLFYTSWVILRLILYPAFSVFVFFEYQRYTRQVGSGINVMAGGLVLILLLTGLGFKWTVDML